MFNYSSRNCKMYFCYHPIHKLSTTVYADIHTHTKHTKMGENKEKPGKKDSFVYFVLIPSRAASSNREALFFLTSNGVEWWGFYPVTEPTAAAADFLSRKSYFLLSEWEKIVWKIVSSLLLLQSFAFVRTYVCTVKRGGKRPNHKEALICSFGCASDRLRSATWKWKEEPWLVNRGDALESQGLRLFLTPYNW